MCTDKKLDIQIPPQRQRYRSGARRSDQIRPLLLRTTLHPGRTRISSLSAVFASEDTQPRLVFTWQEECVTGSCDPGEGSSHLLKLLTGQRSV